MASKAVRKNGSSFSRIPLLGDSKTKREVRGRRVPTCFRRGEDGLLLSLTEDAVTKAELLGS